MLEEETALAAETASAMRELARTVTEAPPLRLAPGRGARAPRTGGQRRWTLWAVPLTAAVAVIALAVALVTIRDLPNGRAAPPTAPTSSPVAGVPAYYAAPETICKTCQSTRLVVGDTYTGAKLATFSPPHGTTFEAVSAAADDRTFVADTVDYPFNSAKQQATWYLLTITPGASTPVRLTRLPIPALPAGSVVGTIALSPSGRELAVTYQFQHSMPPTVLRIYAVATGKLLGSWSATGSDAALGGPFGFTPYAASNDHLSWGDGGRSLSFTTISYTYPKPGDLRHVVVHAALRTLNVTASGGELIRDSRVIWSTQTPDPASACIDDLQVPRLTANGKTIVCDTDVDGLSYGGNSGAQREAFPLSWLSYQLSAPKAARTLYKSTAYTTGSHPVSVNSVQWADASGATLIVAWFVESTTFSALHFGVVSAGRFTPLPTPPGISLGTPPDIAW